MFLLACAEDVVVELGEGEGGGLGLDLSMDLAEVEVQAHTDVRFDWSAVQHDWACDDLVPGSISTVSLCFAPELDHDAVEVAMAQNTMVPSDYTRCLYADVAGVDTVSLYYMEGSLGAPGWFEASPEESWIFQMYTDGGYGPSPVGAQFITPTEPSIVTTAEISDPCGSVDLDVTLGSGTPGPSRDSPNLTLDWSDVDTDLEGAPVTPTDLVDVVVGRFDDAASIGRGLLSDDLGADVAWSMTTTTAPTADLSLLQNDEGVAFSGFDRGTWVVTLRPQGDTDLLPAWMEVFVD